MSCRAGNPLSSNETYTIDVAAGQTYTVGFSSGGGLGYYDFVFTSELAVDPVAPSADFDSNSLIDGFDFLTWQRGFGITAPNATKADGDADNDSEVDHDDLNVWQLQYGTAAPLVAGATASIDTQNVAEPSLAHSDLADVALAVELSEEANGSSDKEEVATDAQLSESFPAEPRRRSNPTVSSSTAASIADLALVGFFRNGSLDEEDDGDGDGWPDDVFALL